MVIFSCSRIIVANYVISANIQKYFFMFPNHNAATTPAVFFNDRPDNRGFA